ncbi:MAG: helix-turn-helix domain-containing protein [Nocardioides sp.]
MVLQRRSRTDPIDDARERGVLPALLRARRRELDLSQVELGDLAGVSYRVVYNLEAGRTEVSVGRLVAVLETLGLHLSVDRGASSVVRAGDGLARHYGLRDEAGGGHGVTADGSHPSRDAE